AVTAMPTLRTTTSRRASPLGCSPLVRPVGVTSITCSSTAESGGTPRLSGFDSTALGPADPAPHQLSRGPVAGTVVAGNVVTGTAIDGEAGDNNDDARNSCTDRAAPDRAVPIWTEDGAVIGSVGPVPAVPGPVVVGAGRVVVVVALVVGTGVVIGIVGATATVGGRGSIAPSVITGTRAVGEMVLTGTFGAGSVLGIDAGGTDVAGTWAANRDVPNN
ncbi:MAG: hypothetical protein ACRDRT_06300, partial [Pseudonocardiaceae bacterium]